jgi:phosphomannomutase
MDLRARAECWIAADPDPDTRAELRALVDSGDEAALAERFGARLEFGTAGIRGPLGAGPGRMNRVVVRRVTAGLAARLAGEPEAAERGVVVGHDARHKSLEFAQDTAGVLAAAGLRVHRIPGLAPTPLVAFAVRHLGAAAGVQITASHNPAADNGYKVYWSDGAQICTPLDAEISAAIDALDPDQVVPVARADDGRIADLQVGLVDAYRNAVLALVSPAGAQAPGSKAREDLRIVYTPLHGVAAPLACQLLGQAGFTDVRVVDQQAQPDPDFPTVAFPNPEVPGALDLAMALADTTGADLILANDPDGDRIAAAVPVDGRWQTLTGDDIGCLLAEWLLSRGERGPNRAVATTVVSSQLLRRIAEAHGVGYAETLTGFKWLARAALQAAAAGGRMVLAYEQALGVMCGTAVLDKDGLSAALVLADMAAAFKAEGRDAAAALDELARRHGLHLTEGRSLRLEGPQADTIATAALLRLRKDPPANLAGVAITSVADHAAGTRTLGGGQVQALSTPPTDLVALTLADGSRLQVRPSGTEPLLKFYFETVEAVAADEPVSAARGRAKARLDAQAEAFLEAAGV